MPTLEPRESIEKETEFAFKSFLAFSTVVFIAPQQFIPILGTLSIGKLAMVLGLIGFLRCVIPLGRFTLVQDRALSLLGYFIALAFASIAFSTWKGGSLDFFLDYVVKAGIVYFLVANLLCSEDRFKTMCWAFTIFTGFNAVLGFNNYRSGAMAPGGRIDGGYAGLVTNPNDLGLFLAMSVPLVWCAYTVAGTALKRLAAISVIALSAVTIIVTFSRGAFLTFVVMAAIFFFNRAKGKRIRVIAIVAVLLVLSIPVMPEGFGKRIVSIFDSAEDDTGSRDERIRLMEAGIESMIEHPLGVGVGMNELSAVNYGAGWHVIHNAYLQVGVELGFLGAFLYVALIWKSYSGLSAIENVSEQFLARLAFAIRLVLVGYAVGAFFGPVAYNFYFYFPGGMAIALKDLAMKTSASAVSEQKRSVVTKRKAMHPALLGR